MEQNFSGSNEKEKDLKPFQGIILFLLVMLCFYTVIYWMQKTFGMYGLAMTEALLFLLAIGATWLCGGSFKKVFPIKRPEWKKTAAVFLGWISSYCLVIPITMTMAYFFPEEIFGVSSSLDRFIGSVPFLLSVIISSVMPAVCEETLHRGFLLKSFQARIRNRAALILLMGFLFGAFHGNIWRFLPTAFLGGVLTWLMLRTENLFYPMLFHFINNFLPSAMAGVSTQESSDAASRMLMEQGVPLFFLGIYFVMACIAPFGFYTASYLMRKGEAEEEQRYLTGNRRLVILVILTVLPVILGMVLFAAGLVKDFL